MNLESVIVSSFCLFATFFYYNFHRLYFRGIKFKTLIGQKHYIAKKVKLSDKFENLYDLLIVIISLSVISFMLIVIRQESAFFDSIYIDLAFIFMFAVLIFCTFQHYYNSFIFRNSLIIEGTVVEEKAYFSRIPSYKSPFNRLTTAIIETKHPLSEQKILIKAFFKNHSKDVRLDQKIKLYFLKEKNIFAVNYAVDSSGAKPKIEKSPRTKKSPRAWYH